VSPLRSEVPTAAWQDFQDVRPQDWPLSSAAAHLAVRDDSPVAVRPVLEAELGKLSPGIAESNRKKMKDNTSKFREEEVVRVLPGVRDPDFGTSIGGWSGKVGKVERSDDGSWLYMIRLDQDTLSAAGDDYEEKCEDENLNFEILYLEEKYLELVNDAGSKEDTFFLA